MNISSVLIFKFAALLISATTLDIHVDPAGSDTNPGTSIAPLATIAKARDVLRASNQLGKQPMTVTLADGVYYLPETLTFTPADSGSKEHPVVYRAKNRGKAVISGGLKLELDWQSYQDGIFQAKTPAGLDIDQLFINATKQRMARYPNYDAANKTAPYQGCAADAFSKKRAVNWANPTGGYIHAMHRARWGGYHYRITGKNAKGEVTYDCLLYTSPSPRDLSTSRMPSSA